MATQIFAQGSGNGPQFARVIRMGNTFTGIANGPEALFYNTAGLSVNPTYSIIMSAGTGISCMTDDVKSSNYGIVIPLSKQIGTLGITFSDFDLKAPSIYSETNTSQNYSVHYAINIFDFLSVGFTGSYFKDHRTFFFTPSNDFTDHSGSGYYMNLSALLKVSEKIISVEDRFQLGLLVSNILNGKLDYKSSADLYIPQQISYGFSYLFSPSPERMSFLKILLACDFKMKGLNNNFTHWYPNFGLELTLSDILHLSYGRENESIFKNLYSGQSSLQYPVNRFGIGVDLILSKYFNTGKDLILKLDYAYSDWVKIKEENLISDYLIRPVKMDRDAFSMSINLAF